MASDAALPRAPKFSKYTFVVVYKIIEEKKNGLKDKNDLHIFSIEKVRQHILFYMYFIIILHLFLILQPHSAHDQLHTSIPLGMISNNCAPTTVMAKYNTLILLAMICAPKLQPSSSSASSPSDRAFMALRLSANNSPTNDETVDKQPQNWRKQKM